MSNGWITLHRKIEDHWLWDSKPFSKGHAWVDILLECNHSERKGLFDGQLITTKRGQSSNSKKTWAKRWGWTISATRHFLNLLESDTMISTHNARVTTVLTVLNYEVYQLQQTSEESQKDFRKISKESQKDTNNKVNKENNVNNDNKKARFSPPSLDEVISLFIEKGSDQTEGEKFFYFYESKNWMVGKNKMKSWASSVAGWVARNKSEEKPFKFETDALV